MKPLLSQPRVTEKLMQTDALLMADLLGITHAVEIIENFLTCLDNQVKEGHNQPEEK
ncbi:hypothetical protein WDV93_24735 [Pantoea ananatis]